MQGSADGTERAQREGGSLEGAGLGEGGGCGCSAARDPALRCPGDPQGAGHCFQGRPGRPPGGCAQGSEGEDGRVRRRRARYRVRRLK